MNRKQYLKQKEARIDKTIQKFRDYGVLTEFELCKLRTKRAWVFDYLKEHTFFTVSGLTGDFMLREWGINLIGTGKSESYVSEMKRVLTYSFRPIISDLLKNGLIEKYNTKTYKVVK